MISLCSHREEGRLAFRSTDAISANFDVIRDKLEIFIDFLRFISFDSSLFGNETFYIDTSYFSLSTLGGTFLTSSFFAELPKA